jgi:hypothetical protein
MSLKVRLYTALLSCVLASSLAFEARADTLHTTGFIFSPADTFEVHRDAVHQNVYVGGFTGTFDLVDVVFWCIDLDHTFSFNQNYDYTEVPLADAALETHLAQLYEEAYGHATTDGADASAAFQLAVWNLRYDSDGSVSAPGSATNHFWATAGHPTNAAIGLANTWLANLGSYTGDGWTITELMSTRNRDGGHHQDFITGTYRPPQHDVPEPSMPALALTALAALLLVRTTYKGEQARGG